MAGKQGVVSGIEPDSRLLAISVKGLTVRVPGFEVTKVPA
jgi:hypothetical protein